MTQDGNAGLKNIKELSFSEYYTSKQKLLEKAEDTPRMYSMYELLTYKKVPVKESYDEEDKVYINFKPKDRIKILWEYDDIYYPTARTFVVISEDGTETYVPCWGSKKLLKWVLSNTKEIDNDN